MRRRDGRSRRLRLGRRLYRRLYRRRHGLRRGQGRQKRRRIDVTVWIRGAADAEVHVGLYPFGLAARADGADDVALTHRGPNRDSDRPEVDERDGPAVLGTDRQAEPLVRKLARVGDDSGCG